MGQVWALVRYTLERFHTNDEEEGEVHPYPSAPPHYFEEKEWPDSPDLSFPEDTGQTVVAPVTVQAALLSVLFRQDSSKLEERVI